MGRASHAGTSGQTALAEQWNEMTQQQLRSTEVIHHIYIYYMYIDVCIYIINPIQ